MNLWKLVYWKQQILYPVWFFILGLYASLVLLNIVIIEDIWWMFPFCGFWIVANRIIYKYSLNFYRKGGQI